MLMGVAEPALLCPLSNWAVERAGQQDPLLICALSHSTWHPLLSQQASCSFPVLLPWETSPYHDDFKVNLVTKQNGSQTKGRGLKARNKGLKLWPGNILRKPCNTWTPRLPNAPVFSLNCCCCSKHQSQGFGNEPKSHQKAHQEPNHTCVPAEK